MSLIVQFLPWIQISLSALLIIAILLQQSEAGLGGTFGGGESAAFHTRRGFEKFLFYFTIVIAILFMVSAFASIIIK